jgi:predicted aldo/keto reductase-like oxidoreductase
MQQAVDLGITYYDTARSYINGEEAVAHLPPSYKDKLVIATKTGARFGRHCLLDLQRSLNTMKRDRIDIWMGHMIRTEQEYEICNELGGFNDIAIAARQAGLVRAIGASFHAPTALILRAIEERAFDVVMFQLNLIGRETVFGSSIESYFNVLLPAARANGVGVVAMKVLAGGELRYGAPRLQFLGNSDRDTVGSAVRYVAMHPDVATAIVGMATSDELRRNVKAVEGVGAGMLPEFRQWTNAVRQMASGECTRCGACLDTCPEGIEIPKVLRLYDQKRFFGMDDVARWRYSELERKASCCERCGKCQEACPENFDIANALEAAHDALQEVECALTPAGSAR